MNYNVTNKTGIEPARPEHEAKYLGKVYGDLKVTKIWWDNMRMSQGWEVTCQKCGTVKEIKNPRSYYNGRFKGNCDACRRKKSLEHRRKTIPSYVADPSLYTRWKAIKERCYRPNHNSYSRYGGRGIRMCDEWLNDYKAFESWAFDNGYEYGLTLDRINADGNYEPSNCRWADSTTQNSNRGDNVVKGVSCVELCAVLGINARQFRRNLSAGDTPEEAYYHTVRGRKRTARPNNTGKPKLHTINGETKNEGAWCRAYGVPRHTVNRCRVKYGVGFEEALELVRQELYGGACAARQ